MVFEMTWGVQFYTKLMSTRHEDEALPEPTTSAARASVSFESSSGAVAGGSGGAPPLRRGLSFKERVTRYGSDTKLDDMEDDDGEGDYDNDDDGGAGDESTGESVREVPVVASIDVF